MFSGCDNLASVTLHDGITSIGEYAFYGCAFSSITLPKKLVTISQYAFNWCENLTSLTFPRSVEVISANAFSYCTKLSTISFHHGVDDNLLIGTDAFYLYSNLATTVKVPVASSVNAGISGYD